MEIKVNDYVRFYDKGWTEIGQIVGEVEDSHLKIVKCRDGGYYDLGDFIKSSPRIIDLIQVGDYVNGKRVNFVYNPDGKQVFRIEFDVDGLKGHMICETKHIKSIVTKEMFEKMEYKLES